MNEWDKEFRQVLKRIADCYDIPHEVPKVLHIGGHVGQEAEAYAELGMLATYCEPVPGFVQRIRSRGLAHRVFEIAVGKSGIITMNINGQESSIMGKKKKSRDNWQDIDVLSVPLSTLQIGQRWNVLVIDAQGATMPIMRSGRVEMFDWVIAEASVAAQYPGEESIAVVRKYMHKEKGFDEFASIQHGDKDIFDLIFKNKKRRE